MSYVKQSFMENKIENPALNLAELKKLLQDCFVVKPWIYWFDYLVSLAIFWISFLLVEKYSAPWIKIPFFILSGFALYRCLLFIHELTHLDRKDIPFFSIFFNLTSGIPCLVPSFMYRGVHLDHHKKNSYGTHEDGEYTPFGAMAPWHMLLYFSQCFTIPVALALRFALLNPISLLHPKLRKILMERGSALAIRFDVARKIPTGIDLRNWAILDVLGTLYIYALAALFLTHTLPWSVLLHIYLLLVFVMFVNSIRTVVAHRYRNKSLQEMSFQDQLSDSVNIEGNFLFHELMAPVGLRFHALHHIFPSMPYHSLETAHRRLKKLQLPFYEASNEASLFSALAHLWNSAKEAR